MGSVAKVLTSQVNSPNVSEENDVIYLDQIVQMAHTRHTELGSTNITYYTYM